MEFTFPLYACCVKRLEHWRMRCKDLQDRDGSGTFGAKKRRFRTSAYIDFRFFRIRNIRREKWQKEAWKKTKKYKILERYIKTSYPLQASFSFLLNIVFSYILLEILNSRNRVDESIYSFSVHQTEWDVADCLVNVSYGTRLNFFHSIFGHF